MKLGSSGKEEEKKKSLSSLHHDPARTNENVLYLKHTSTKYQHRFCRDFLTVSPQTVHLFRQEQQGLDPQLPSWELQGHGKQPAKNSLKRQRAWQFHGYAGR